MKILVIGGAGYIGSSFVNYVFENTNYEVVILDDLSTGFKEAIHEKSTFILGSILDKDLLDKIFKEHKIDGVFHFAAKLIVPESIREPAKYWLNNVGGVATLIESMKDNNIKNLVFSSTAAVYGFPETIPVDENAKTNPCNPYGSSKLACETLIKESHKAYDLNYVIFRYFNVAGANKDKTYGLRQKNPTLLIPVVNKSVIEDFEMSVYGNDYENTKDGTCIRDYIHIDDLVRAHLLGFEWMIKNNKSETFNLGTSNGYSVLEVLNTAEQVINKKIKYKFASRRPGDPDRLITKNERAKTVLGWTPNEKLEDMIKSDFEFRKKL